MTLGRTSSGAGDYVNYVCMFILQELKMIFCKCIFVLFLFILLWCNVSCQELSEKDNSSETTHTSNILKALEWYLRRNQPEKDSDRSVDSTFQTEPSSLQTSGYDNYPYTSDTVQPTESEEPQNQLFKSEDSTVATKSSSDQKDNLYELILKMIKTSLRKNGIYVSSRQNRVTEPIEMTSTARPKDKITLYVSSMAPAVDNAKKLQKPAAKDTRELYAGRVKGKKQNKKNYRTGQSIKAPKTTMATITNSPSFTTEQSQFDTTRSPSPTSSPNQKRLGNCDYFEDSKNTCWLIKPLGSTVVLSTNQFHQINFHAVKWLKGENRVNQGRAEELLYPIETGTSQSYKLENNGFDLRINSFGETDTGKYFFRAFLYRKNMDGAFTLVKPLTFHLYVP